MSSIKAYELIYRDSGKKEEKPDCIQDCAEKDVSEEMQQKEEETGDVSADVTLESLTVDYIKKGYDLKTAVNFAKADFQNKKKEDKQREKEERQREKAERQREKAEEEYNRMIKDGMEDIYPYLDVEVVRGVPRISHTLNNYIQVLERHADFVNKLNLNEFTQMDEWEKKPLTNRRINLIAEVLEHKLGYFDPTKLKSALMNVCTKHPYHPVKEVLDTLVWDKVPRVETFFIDRNGGEDTPLTREISFKWLFAMVKRIYEPGCFFDHYLVLRDNKQGTGKTGTFQRLTEGLGTSMGSLTNENISIDLSDKDNVMALLDCSIGLLDESSKVKYGDKCEAFKAFMSQRTYVFRPPYGLCNEHIPTHNVIAMTTNDEAFLTDSSGDYERRAWVIRCVGDPDRTPEEWEKYNSDDVIKQVWAELKYYYDHQDEAPHKVTGKHVTILSQKAKEELIKVQKTVKTLIDDFPCENAITDILENQRYSQDTFVTSHEFIHDLDSIRFNEEKYTRRLDVIPANWLYEYINKKIGSKGNRSSRYIKQMIRSLIENGVIGQWTLDNHKYYNKKQTTCFVRVVETPDTHSTDDGKVTVDKKTDPWKKQSLLPK